MTGEPTLARGAVMGSRLAAAAYAPFDGLALSKSARIVLWGMCTLARDDGDPPAYYGGWPYLSRGLGYAIYTPVAERAVARAVAELRKHGLIVAIDEAQPGRNVSYAIRL